jgi:hypothetical protein
MKTLVMIVSLVSALTANAFDYDMQSYDWGSSSANFDNSPANFNNSPANFDNSPAKYGNDRLIYNTDGSLKGYVVPKPDGGKNYFDPSGNRKGYSR